MLARSSCLEIYDVTSSIRKSEWGSCKMCRQHTQEGAKDNRATELRHRGLHTENVQVSQFRFKSFVSIFLNFNPSNTPALTHQARCRWRRRGLKGRRPQRQSAAFWHKVRGGGAGRCGSVLGGSWSRPEDEQVDPVEKKKKSRPESLTEASNWLFIGRWSRFRVPQPGGPRTDPNRRLTSRDSQD